MFGRCAELYSERNHQVLFSTMGEFTGQLFNFEGASVLFMDQQSGMLYQLDRGEDEEGRVYAKNVHHLPSNLGITGICVKCHEVVLSASGKEDARFNNEIDNVGERNVKNLVVGPMLDRSGRLMGIVHLVNYEGDWDEFDASQQRRFLSMLTVFAECVNNADEFNSLWSISFGYLEGMKRINAEFDSGLQTVSENNECLDVANRSIYSSSKLIRELTSSKFEFLSRHLKQMETLKGDRTVNRWLRNKEAKKRLTTS